MKEEYDIVEEMRKELKYEEKLAKGIINGEEVGLRYRFVDSVHRVGIMYDDENALGGTGTKIKEFPTYEEAINYFDNLVARYNLIEGLYPKKYVISGF